jgi:hypothetical protein
MIKYIVKNKFVCFDFKSHCNCGITDYCIFCGSEPFKNYYNPNHDCEKCHIVNEELIECKECKEYENNYTKLKAKLRNKENKINSFIESCVENKLDFDKFDFDNYLYCNKCHMISFFVFVGETRCCPIYGISYIFEFSINGKEIYGTPLFNKSTIKWIKNNNSKICFSLGYIKKLPESFTTNKNNLTMTSDLDTQIFNDNILFMWLHKQNRNKVPFDIVREALNYV